MTAYLLLPLIQSLFCSVLAVIVLRRHFWSFIHRLFALFLIGLATWGIIIFGMRISPDIGHAYLWERWLIPLSPFMSVLFYHFAVRYTTTKIKSWLLPFLYVICLLFIPLAATDLVFSGMQIKPYGYAPIPGPAMPFWSLFSFVVLLMALAIFARTWRTSPYAEKRNRPAYILIGIVVAFIGGVFDILPALGLPSYPGLIIGNIVFCLLATVAVLRYHLLDIHIVVRKGTTYFLMSAIIAIPYVGVIFLFHELFGEAFPLWAHLILLVLLAVFLRPLWSKMQQLVDRWFYRERYNFLKALEDFSQETRKISDISQLGPLLVKLISQALQSSGVYLLLSSNSGDFSVAASAGENTSQVNLDSRSPLLRWLQSNKSVLRCQDLDIIPQLQSLTEKETNELKKIRVELFAPIITKEEELVGMLILGPKLSQQPYSEEDERLVSTVASRMAIELENARLYSLERMLRTELQRQDEQKTEFLHSVAHELKTPLTAIISSSKILSTELSSANLSQRERLIRNITQSACSMEKRVTELLDFAKIQIGELKLQTQPLEVGLAIEDIASGLLILFKNKKQSLTLEITNPLPKVKADRGKFEQILVNLLSNANKFSPPGSNITLRARAVDNKVTIEVEDSAPLIIEEEKAKIFNPYYRGEDAYMRQHLPGLGLGLAICKKLVELHQGQIWVDSKLGKGNIFAISLPACSEE